MSVPRALVAGAALALSAVWGGAVGATTTGLLVSHRDHAALVREHAALVRERAARAAEAVATPSPDATTSPGPVDGTGLPAAQRAVVDDDATSEALAALASGDGPQGTPVEIALRFVQDLQRGDDLAAARLLSWDERLRLSRTDQWVLARVMQDVRRHARLDASSLCRHARQYDEMGVLVACGGVRVLVRVDPAWMADHAVRVFDGKAPDEYRHDHTFAFSTVQA